MLERERDREGRPQERKEEREKKAEEILIKREDGILFFLTLWSAPFLQSAVSFFSTQHKRVGRPGRAIMSKTRHARMSRMARTFHPKQR